MMNSPLRALEKLSEEAKLERQRSTGFLQENARLKVQIDGLKASLDEALFSNQSLEGTIEKLEEVIDQQNGRISSLEQELEGMKGKLLEAQDHSVQMASMEKDMEGRIQLLIHEKEIEQTEKEERMTIVTQLEEKLATKDDIIAQNREEIMKLKLLLENAEEKSVLLTTHLNETTKTTEMFKLRSEQTARLQDEITVLQSANHDIRQELRQCLSMNSQLREEMTTVTQRNRIAESSLDTAQGQIRQLQKEKEELIQTIQHLEHAQEALYGRMEAERETLTAAQLQAEVAAKGREFVDQQIKDMKDAFDRVNEHNRQLEKELTEAKVIHSQLNNDVLAYKEKIQQMDSMVSQVENAQSMAMEIEYLRSQLSDMRRRLIKKDMNDDAANHLPPQTLMEREQNSRMVYEGIILDLRTELDKLTTKHHETTQKLEMVMRKAARVEQLEEEVRMYREAAHSTAMESQSVAISASEALERSEKNAHEKHLILRELKEAETELQNRQIQIARLQDELQLERTKSKKILIEKLTAERKASELLAGKARSEALLDELKQGHDNELLELERSRRLCKEYTITIHDLRKQMEELEISMQVTQQSEMHMKHALNESLGKEHALNQEIRLLQQQKDQLLSDLTNAQHSLNNQKHLLDQNQIEIKRLTHMVEDLQLERERYRKDTSMHESMRTETQLQSLRKELEQAVHDWRASEEEKEQQQQALNAVQVELNKEKEKANTLRTQVVLLEDRVNSLLQELSIYRSLDVYQQSKEVELATYRQSQHEGTTLGMSTPNRFLSSSHSQWKGTTPSLSSTRGFASQHTVDAMQEQLNRLEQRTATVRGTPAGRSSVYGDGRLTVEDMSVIPASAPLTTTATTSEKLEEEEPPSSPDDRSEMSSHGSSQYQSSIYGDDVQRRKEMRLAREKAKERSLMLELSDTRRFRAMNQSTTTAAGRVGLSRSAGPGGAISPALSVPVWKATGTGNRHQKLVRTAASIDGDEPVSRSHDSVTKTEYEKAKNRLLMLKQQRSTQQ